MPKLTKLDDKTVELKIRRPNVTLTKKELKALDSQVMHTFTCAKCGMSVKSITRKAEFFCGTTDHKGYRMELK